jgi:hypothetical protein
MTRPTPAEDRAAMATSAFDSLAYIRDHYGVPAQLSGRVLYTWQAANQLGTIVGTSGARLLVLMDGERRAVPFHPTWELQYLTDAELPSGGEPR